MNIELKAELNRAPQWLRPAVRIGGRATIMALTLGVSEGTINAANNAADANLQDSPAAHIQEMSAADTSYYLTKGITLDPQIAEAAGKTCLNTNLLLVGVASINNPYIPNRPLNADPVDYVIGPAPEFGVAVATYKEDVRDQNSKEHELRGYMADKGSYRQTIFKFPAGTKSNTLAEDGRSEALQVEYYFEDDAPQLNKATGKMEKPRGKALIKCTETVPALGHRTLPIEELEKTLRDQNHQFRTVASIVNEAMRDFTKQPYNLKPETVDQAEVRRAVREYLEKQKAAQTPTVTPTVTGTPKPEATGTPTPEAGPGISGGNSLEIKDWAWLPASIFGAGALAALALMFRRRGWRWPRRKTGGNAGEIVVNPPPVTVRVNTSAEPVPPFILDVSFPAPRVTIRPRETRRQPPTT